MSYLERIVNNLDGFDWLHTEPAMSGGEVAVLSYNRGPAKGFELKVEIEKEKLVKAYYDRPTSRGGTLPVFLYEGDLDRQPPVSIAKEISKRFYDDVVIPAKDRTRSSSAHHITKRKPMKNLKQQLIRLGYQDPSLRKHLRPIIANLEKVAKATAGDLVDLMAEMGLPAPDEPANGRSDSLGGSEWSRVIPHEGEMTDMLFQALEDGKLVVKGAGVEADAGNFYDAKAVVILSWDVIAEEYLMGLDDFRGQYAKPQIRSAVAKSEKFRKMIADSLPAGSTYVDREMPAPLRKKIDSVMRVPEDVVDRAYDVGNGKASWKGYQGVEGLAVQYEFRMHKFN